MSRPLRVVIVGSESTGKTTLAQQLAEHYETEWVPEYGREYTIAKYHGELEQRGVGEAGPWVTKDFVIIARTQQLMENEAAARVTRLLVCDTNAFATAIWHERYMGFRDDEVEMIAARDVVDLYLLTANDVPFEEDGLRDGMNVRDWMFERFRTEIERLEIPFAYLEGDRDRRFAAAVAAIDRLLDVGSRN